MERGAFNFTRENSASVLAATYLTVLPYRFTFRALDPIFFPEGKAANTLRGALGVGLRRVSCPADCERAGPDCNCPYNRLFSPHAHTGPSGFADPPRPFRHPRVGLIGTVTYTGPLAEFLPWLRAGYWTGVGRQTVWGKGVIDLR